MNKKQKKVLARIIIAAVLMIILHFIPVKGIIRFLLYMVPYLVIGYDILKKAFKGIKNKQVFDENFLMAVATVYRGYSRYALLPDRRTVSELCSRKEP